MSLKPTPLTPSTDSPPAPQPSEVFFRYAPGLFCILELDGRIRAANPAFIAMCGFRSDELYQHPLKRFIHEGDHDQMKTYLEAHEYPREYEVRWLHPDGRVVWLSFRTVRTGESLLMVAHETTSQHNQAIESAGISALIDTILRYLPDLVYIKDTNHRFIYGNPAIATQLGAANIEDIIGRTDADFSPTDLASQYMYDEARVMMTGQPLINHEEQVYHKGLQQFRWLNTTKVPFYDGDGQLAGIIGINRDITERKIEVQALHAQKKLLEQITSATPDRIYVFNVINRTYTFVNRTIFQILGFTPDQVAALGPNPVQHIFNEFDPLTTDRWIARLNAAGDGEVVESQVQMHDAQGKVRWMYSRDRVFSRNPDGSLREILGISQDITERRRAEDELHNQKHMVDRLMQAVPDYLNLFDLDIGRSIYQNRSLIEMLGYTPEQIAAIQGDPVDYLFTSVDSTTGTRWRSQIESADEYTLIEMEVPVLAGDGSVHWLHTRDIAFAMREDGRPRQIVGIAQDITARKQASIELQEQKHMVERIMTASPNFIALFDVDERRYLFQNRDLFAMMNYSPEQVAALGENPIQALFTSVDNNEAQDFLADIAQAADDDVIEREVCVRAGDGSLRWVLTRDIIFSRHPDGRPHQTVGTTQDITERRTAEDTLREQKLLIDQITMTTPDFIGVYDLDEKCHVYSNRGLGTLLGYTAEAWNAMGGDAAYKLFADGQPEKHDTWLKRVYTAKDGELIESTSQVKGSDGHWHWLHTRDVVFKRRTDGTPYQVVGVTQDITARTKAEQELSEQQRFVERVIKASADILTVYDLIDERYLFRSHDLFERLGYTPQQVEAMGPNPTQKLFSAYSPKNTLWRERLNHAGDHDVVETESRVMAADGTMRWLFTRDTILTRTPDGRPRQIVGVLQDITARRNAEDELREQERFVKRITSATPDYLFLYDLEDVSKNYMNRPLLEMLGYTQEQIAALGERPLTALFKRDAPEVLEKWYSRFRECPDGEVLETEFHVRGGTGEWRWLQIRETVFDRHEDGTPYQSVGVGQDITERKRVEEELREQKRFIEQIATTSPDMLYVYDLEKPGNVYSNYRVSDKLGYSAEEISAMGGDIITATLHPDDMALLADRLEHFNHIQDGEIVETEYRMQHRSGKWMWLYSREMIFKRNDHGGPLQIVGAAHDITARREAENALREQKRFVEKIAAAAPDYIYVFDLDTLCNIYTNRDLLVMLDYTPQQIADMGPDPLVTLYAQNPGTTPREKWIAQLSATNEGEWLEFIDQIVGGDGQPRWLHKRDTVFTRHPDGSPRTVLGSAQDITARKQAEEQALNLAIEQQRLAVLKEFISAASHDLRTPLSVMKANFYLARRHTDPIRRLEYIDDLEIQTNRLHALIEDMLTLSRLDMTQLVREPLDINQTMRELVAEHQALADEHQHHLYLDAAPDRLIMVASAPEIRRALINLIVNAINYTPNGGTITMRCHKADSSVIIDVEDTGVGIAPENLERIFDSFYRVDTARSSDKGGTGLGLTITKRIIEAHNGKITVHSTLGQGTLFRIILPLT